LVFTKENFLKSTGSVVHFFVMGLDFENAGTYLRPRQSSSYSKLTNQLSVLEHPIHAEPCNALFVISRIRSSTPAQLSCWHATILHSRLSFLIPNMKQTIRSRQRNAPFQVRRFPGSRSIRITRRKRLSLMLVSELIAFLSCSRSQSMSFSLNRLSNPSGTNPLRVSL